MEIFGIGLLFLYAVTWPKLRVLLSMMEDKVHSYWSWDYKVV